MNAVVHLPAWGYPLLEVAHIAGVGVLFGNLLLMELRVFGLGGALDVHALARLALGLVAVGFVVLAMSGFAMFMTQPAELLANRAFVAKMLLVMAGAINAGLFHARGSLARLDRVARGQMILSTLIWLAVIACGRWIAYV